MQLRYLLEVEEIHFAQPEAIGCYATFAIHFGSSSLTRIGTSNARRVFPARRIVDYGCSGLAAGAGIEPATYGL
jgi:hypothetical protein